MNTHPSLLQRCSVSVRRLGFLALATLSTVATMHGAVDPSISRAAWGMAFGVAPEQLVSAEWLTEDADGDGQSNSAELASATNPQDATSVLAVAEIKLVGKNLELAFPTVAGKSYTLQENVGLSGSTAWEAAATPAKQGTGTALTFSVPKQAGTYYRVFVQDADTDDDGISGYAENIFVTNSELYPNGPPVTSGGVSASSASSIVTVSAPESLAYEDGPARGMFTVTRTGDTTALIVGYTISGTATRAGIAGADHNRVSGSTNMAINQNSFTLPVMPVVDNTLEAAESCTLTITYILSMEPTGPWSIPPGTPNAATVLIYNSALSANGTGLLGQYSDTASSTDANSANFNAAQLKVSRVDSTVDFNWLQGTPNGAVILPNNSADNYSATWEGYLQRTTAGTYIFQLDPEDKARVLLDTGSGLSQILEHGWDTSSTVSPADGVADNETIGTFKGTSINPHFAACGLT